MKVLQSREIFFLEKWKFNIWKLLIVQDSLKIVCKINFDFQFAARLFQSSHPFEIHFFFTLIHHFHNMSFNSGQACYVSVCYYVDLFFSNRKKRKIMSYTRFSKDWLTSQSSQWPKELGHQDFRIFFHHAWKCT